MRSTGELVVLIIAGTLAVAVLIIGAGLVVLAIVNPELDMSRAWAAFTGLLNTMLGMLAGLLIGRARVGQNGK